MRSDLTRNDNDSRTRECGDATDNGSPCPRAVAPGPNPLGLCDDHLRAYLIRNDLPLPAECPACVEGPVIVGGRYVFPVGAMCFTCGVARGGTVATPVHRTEARSAMIARIGAMLAAGDRGPEWAATLARAPADVRERAERACVSRVA